MKSAVFSFSTDAKLIPKHRNLCQRNGIFYFRKMVDGKRVYKSLKTDDPYLARHLLNRILLAEPFLSSHKVSLNKTQFAMFNVDFCKINTLPFDEKNVVLKTSGKTHIQKVENMNPNINATDTTVAIGGHKILDIWNNNIKHTLSNGDRDGKDFKTATNRVKLMVEFLKVGTIEEIYDNPGALDNMFAALEKYKHKGKPLAKTTIKNYVTYLKQINDVAIVNKWVIPDAAVTLRLNLGKYVFKNWGFGESKTRVPLSDSELDILFKSLYKLKNKNFDFVEKAMNMSQYDNSLLQYIKDYPKTITFVILLSLFTGARANAATTLRIRDIDAKENTIFFRIDKKLVDKQDVREMQKALKNNDAERMLPVSDIIKECGFWEYVSEQRAKYGSAAFVFEDAIVNQNGQGYRTQNVNEAVNELLKILGFKSAVSQSEMLDMHSFKETFYTFNGNVNERLSRDLLEAFAGNAPSSPSISSQNYNKPTYQRHKNLFINAAKIITFPHVEELFGGKLPDSLNPAQKETNTKSETTQPISVPIIGSRTKDAKLVEELTGLVLTSDTRTISEYATSISKEEKIAKATIAAEYGKLDDFELVDRLFRCHEIIEACSGKENTLFENPILMRRVATLEGEKVQIAYEERYAKNKKIYDIYEMACVEFNPARLENRLRLLLQQQRSLAF